MSVIEQIANARIVAIFRGDYQGRWGDYAGGLLRGGIRAMEITLNSPGAREGITALKETFGSQIVIGAGTVLSADEVHQAVNAGAAFIVAPDTDESVIAACKERGVVVIPGAYTATEIKRAHALGADMVKLFPAQTPDYLKAIRAPLSHIPIMATGGVDVTNAAEFLKAGAAALGIGSSLTKPTLKPDEVAHMAAQFVAVSQGLRLA